MWSIFEVTWKSNNNNFLLKKEKGECANGKRIN